MLPKSLSPEHTKHPLGTAWGSISQAVFCTAKRYSAPWRLDSRSMTKIQYQQDEQRWSSLMVAAQSGDERDYEQLLRELCTFIEGYLHSRIGAHQSIDDWVQNILIAIHRGRHTYNPRRPIRPWLFAIIRYQTIDGLRRQKSYCKMLEQQTEHIACQHNQNHQAADSTLLEGRLLQALKPQHREALTLTKLIGLSYKEAAEQLGVSEASLKVRVHRGIKQLKKLLEAEPYE